MKKPIKPFDTKGAISRPRGRRPLIDEVGRSHTFLDHLNRVDIAALPKVVERLYKLAVKEDNAIVATRACELILAYAIGKPATTEHDPNKKDIQITFTRAEPLKSLPDRINSDTDTQGK